MKSYKEYRQKEIRRQFLPENLLSSASPGLAARTFPIFGEPVSLALGLSLLLLPAGKMTTGEMAARETTAFLTLWWHSEEQARNWSIPTNSRWLQLALETDRYPSYWYTPPDYICGQGPLWMTRGNQRDTERVQLNDNEFRILASPGVPLHGDLVFTTSHHDINWPCLENCWSSVKDLRATILEWYTTVLACCWFLELLLRPLL